MIAIIDYGAGNLRSVKKAFDYLGGESCIASSIEVLAQAQKLVLPGVGAFGAAMNRLTERGFKQAISDWISADKPFLGICLGLQLLFESSAESAGVAGLGFFKGSNQRFQSGKVPQIGWNQITIQKPSVLLEGIEDGSFFYFLHSYYIMPHDNAIVTTTTDYGIAYPSIVERGNVHAVQFHPEKSGEAGLKLLKNWVELC